MKKRIVVLSGAGVSAESGIQTFRDADGLWEGMDVMSVASPEGWHKDMKLVLAFYNQRRRQLKEVKPNAAHFALTELEEKYDVTIITQNIDNLHELAGSSDIIHLHGELTKVRSTLNHNYVLNWEDDLNIGDNCPDGGQLRPHIVWFGEAVPMIKRASVEISAADVVIIVGTSMQVYPAAGLVSYAPIGTPIYYVDPKPAISLELKSRGNLKIIAEKAGTGVRKVVDELLGE